MTTPEDSNSEPSTAIRRTLIILAARHRLGIVGTDELIAAADDLLTAGLYSDTILECADLARAAVIDGLHPERLFLAICAEYSIASPTDAHALWIVIADVMDRILDETTAPLDGLHEIIELVRILYDTVARGGAHAAMFSGDYDLDDFVRAHWEHDARCAKASRNPYALFRRDRARQRTGDFVRKLARKWRRRHPVDVDLFAHDVGH